MKVTKECEDSIAYTHGAGKYESDERKAFTAGIKVVDMKLSGNVRKKGS
jgi:hypothetical protein